METPYRNNKMIEDLVIALKAVFARHLTLNTEYIRTLSINEWKKNKINIDKKPAIFIIHKN